MAGEGGVQRGQEGCSLQPCVCGQDGGQDPILRQGSCPQDSAQNPMGWPGVLSFWATWRQRGISATITEELGDHCPAFPPAFDLVSGTDPYHYFHALIHQTHD